MSDVTPHRPIRSFVRREGHLTQAQRRALEQLWPRYGIELGGGMLDPAVVFGRCAPLVMEIGFGNGEALAAVATQHPDNNYLGVEVHRPGVGHLLRALSAQNLGNVRIVCADVNDVLAQLPDDSLAGIFLFFPDPWPKKRHHKRRLVQPAFVQIIRRKLALGGKFFLATDWEDYALQMLQVLSEAEGFANEAGAGCFAARSPARPLTKFERRGRRLGHEVRDLSFRRVA